MKFCNIHGQYKPQLNEYFHMYRCQLNFAMFCATSTLGFFWQHLNHSNLFLRSVYRFHIYFHARIILKRLGISLPHEDGFSQVNYYVKSVYYSICDNYDVNGDETWMHGDWFYTTNFDIFGDGRKTTKRSQPYNLIQWIITQSKSFTKKGIEKISRSVRAYVYLVLTYQVQARSSIAGNSA